MTTYEAAGVDLNAAERLVGVIRDHVASTWHADVIGGFGGFAGGIRLPGGLGLMMSTDGVGTKAEVARRSGLLEGLGHDLVAMCADDLVAAGARPVAMTDYIATGSLDLDWLATIVGSIARACREAGIALVGGETAEHPGVMEPDEFDLAGTAIGIVADPIDGSAIRPGDLVMALPSPNVRANGFSLIRSALLSRLDLDDTFPDTDSSFAEVLMEPSVLYTPLVTPYLQEPIHGMAHVTGGGIAGNLSRILPSGLGAHLDASTWQPPHVFDVIERIGSIERREMFRTFNMGVGFLLVVPEPIDLPGAWVLGQIRDESGIAGLA